MKEVSELYAWREGIVVARFLRTDSSVRLEYAPKVVQPLSVSLPVNGGWKPEAPSAWLKNLLPNNKNVWNQIARDRGATRGSIFSLLSAIGEDLPGNVSLLERGQEPGKQGVSPTRVSEGEIEDAILESKKSRRSPITRFGSRLSLAGMQDKFSLSFIRGAWYESSVFLPSTHIFKPGPNALGLIEEAEAYTQTLASACGVRAASGEKVRFSGGETSYVTTRFDRVQSRRGLVRLHMEDLSQVMGLDPEGKYNTNLSRIFSTLREAGMPETELYVLVQQIMFNVLVGNADAHSKNYSILHTQEGLRVSPLYDCVPVGYYAPVVSDTLAMGICGKKYSRDVTERDWLSWGEQLGIGMHITRSMYHELLVNIKNNAGSVAESLGTPESIYRFVVSGVQ